MKISSNDLRYYREQYDWSGDPVPDGVAGLVRKIGSQLGAVEETTAFGSRFDGVIVAKVMSCDDHPDADRLHVCKLDDGGKMTDVERDNQGYVQVVCGAPNVRESLLVAWLPPGATVPESLDKDPFVLEARPLRGVVSNGMLASPKELTIGDNHDGILEVDVDVQPGTSFAEAYNLTDDVVIDIENKMFTHRPDCFGLIGVAREIAGIQQQKFTSPAWYWRSVQPDFPETEGDELKLEVRNELPELVPRLSLATMRNVTVKPSPVWLQIMLAKIGVRSINNIVDYTNYYMYMTGQPLHAYDYDKVMAQDTGATHATIVVRHPKEGETILLLNGKKITPRAEAIMIATRDTLVGVGGVMGGGDTEVDDTTKNIIIECANFDMYSIRRTSMAHGLFTDAVTRFNKGQSPLQNRVVLAKIVNEIHATADGQLASEIIDDNHLSAEVQDSNALHPAITVTQSFINKRLGFDLSAEAMATLLQNVEFAVLIEGDTLTITAPFWRTDIEIPEDIVEEVGRLHGFDHLPLELPARLVAPTEKDAMFELKAQIRAYLSSAGANELLTYSFVHGNLLEKVGQSPDHAFQLSNALSPDLQYYRIDVLPSLLDKVSLNLKAGYDAFALFEMGKGHTLLHKDDDEGLPKEFNMLAFVYAANDKLQRKGAAFYQAREYLVQLAEALGIELDIVPITEVPDLPVAKPYDPARAAFVKVKGSEHYLGMIGEFRTSVRKQLKLPQYSAGFEIDIDMLRSAPHTIKEYVLLPRFPKIEQDICLKVPTSTDYDQVYQFVHDKLDIIEPENVLSALSPVDIYQRDDDQDHKQITLRFSIASYERTLTDQEVAAMLDNIAEAAASDLHAERI
jgi:phenylalanyl-tRNA synthetase beta chain